MPAPAKFTEVMAVLKRRIAAGDYLVAAIPGERRIAEETGVSYMTARRAIQGLLEEAVLVRGETGALEVHPRYAKRAKAAEFVLLYPAFPSLYLTQLRGRVADYAQRRGVRVRPIQFIHWDEAAVLDAVEQARGTDIIPSGEPMPERLLEPLRSSRTVFLDGDWSAEGLPSIRLFSDASIGKVFERLARLGHRRIDCLNTQNRNPEIDRRIQLWEQFLDRRGLTGQLFDDPAPNYADPTAAAYALMRDLLEERKALGTALVTTTCPGAIGAIRACWERGVAVGKELSIAAVNIEPPAEYFCPSIAGLSTPDLDGVLAHCFDWFESRSGVWTGPRLLEPRGAHVFRGESVAKPRRTTRRATRA